VGVSRQAHRWPALGVAMVMCLALVPMGHPAHADGTGPTFQNSGLSGGGFISVLAQSTSTGTVVAGGDTQGFFRSVNDGQTWTPQDAGLPASGYHVAALLSVGTTWYAAVGDGSNGGVAVSLDDGVTWTESPSGKGAAPPVFDGTNLPGQNGNPRATGALLASDGTYLYAASFGRGLQRWALKSVSPAAGWSCVALCSSFLNSVALDGKGDAFISVISRAGASEGVDEVTGLGSKVRTKVISAKKGVSSGVQELLSLGSRVYAAGANGIGYWNGTAWLVLDSTQHWYTLTGYETVAGETPVDVLYAATYAGHGIKDVEQLMVNGTHVVITGLVPPDSVGANIYGTSTPWWEGSSAGTAGDLLGPEAMIGGCASSTSTLCAGNTTDVFAGSSILLGSRNGGAPDAMLVSGRSGIWDYAPGATPAWLPAVAGLDSTFDLGVSVDPADPANVAASDADWNVIGSTDDMTDVDGAVAPPRFTTGSSTGLALTWDASVSPSALIISGGNRATNSLGSIWYDATWATGGPWTSLSLPAGVAMRPIALAAQVTGPNDYVLLAAFQKKGVYAFTATGTTGTWALIPPPSGSSGPTVSPNDVHGVSLAWASDGSAVFMYDEGTHAVWESLFIAGVFAPWTELYADTTVSPGRGWVAADPSTPSVVWISNTNGLGYIDTAACTPTCPPPTWVTSSPGGPLATYTNVNGDYVYMASGGATPSFWEVQVTQCAVSCPTPTGFNDPYFDEVAGNATSLAAGADGFVYLATLGNGIAIGTAA
jgi:hypothetical protein